MKDKDSDGQGDSKQIREKLDVKDVDRKTQIVEALIQKPTLKDLVAQSSQNDGKFEQKAAMGSRPDFGSLKSLYDKPNSSLQKVKDFLPDFIKETKEIMNDDSIKKKKQMNIKIQQGLKDQ